MPEQFVQIGQVLGCGGTDGSVLISLKNGFRTSDINKEEPLYICFDGLAVPFFISEMFPRSATRMIAGLVDVNSRRDAEELSGKAIYLPCGQDENAEGEDFTGWTLFDCAEGSRVLVGEIEGMVDIPGNPCLELKGGMLVPLSEELIEEMDMEGRRLVMRLPGGLKDI